MGGGFYVAPFAGAWIEIPITAAVSPHVVVAPFAGAWIEISKMFLAHQFHVVAPFAGAWIEILILLLLWRLLLSLPLRERGLKFF